MTVDRVADDEDLYRRVPPASGSSLCYQVDNGRVIFKTGAFNDSAKRPSVDRAIFRLFDPNRTRLTSDDGVIVLRAEAIRKLGPMTQSDYRGKPVTKHLVDVSPKPIFFSNCSHAEVNSQPELGSNGFRRLKDALVRLANEASWHVHPQAVLPRKGLGTMLLEHLKYFVSRLH